MKIGGRSVAAEEARFPYLTLPGIKRGKCRQRLVPESMIPGTNRCSGIRRGCKGAKVCGYNDGLQESKAIPTGMAFSLQKYLQIQCKGDNENGSIR
jgi:hypothetical protein